MTCCHTRQVLVPAASTNALQWLMVGRRLPNEKRRYWSRVKLRSHYARWVRAGFSVLCHTGPPLCTQMTPLIRFGEHYQHGRYLRPWVTARGHLAAWNLTEVIFSGALRHVARTKKANYSKGQSCVCWYFYGCIVFQLKDSSRSFAVT